MNKLTVMPIELTDQNTILPFPAIGAEELILYAKSPDFKQIVHYVNISGGIVVMGLDENKVLRDIEFNLSRKYWTVVPQIKKPESYVFAGLELIEVNEKGFEIDLPVTAHTDSSYSIAEFIWGETEGPFSGKWYALSEYCFAQVIGDKFISFLICLDQDD